MPTQSANLRGQSLIAGEPTFGEAGETTGWNPSTNESLSPTYSLLAIEQLGAATEAAAESFTSFRSLDPTTRANFLEQIAQNLTDSSETIIERAKLETGLPESRLRGEISRTTGQLSLFARLVRSGDHHGVRIDPERSERDPRPRTDIRQRKIPVGPVAIFGASNFPLAFSTAGGDTAAALAAGCPVVFKAHNAHPGTSELVGNGIMEAVKKFELHPGVFSLVFGVGTEIGQALVSDPNIAAVGFTGSRSGGLALLKTASERPIPIPVYAEMSSINPVYIFQGALRDDKSDIKALANTYLSSVTGSSGQLCTQPGLVFVPSTTEGDEFVEAVANAIEHHEGQTMLTSDIHNAWLNGIHTLATQEGVVEIGRGETGTTQNSPAPTVFQASIDAFLSNPVLQSEIFGAVSLMVRYKDIHDLLRASQALEGQLTTTLRIGKSDLEGASHLLPILEQKAGRLLVNDWPTGVEVGHAMVHGGPFTATSDPRSTSVGTLAIERFLRPVAYQNFPQELLPASLKNDNPWQLNRLIDGVVTKVDEK